ncbi:cytochrome d ubiquinol oxidase subunit II [Arthrobacter stackebrandtii]|uniref:Cytochrome d ubiquinol oxidase subunit II n=1 Tax=Arthrobacter stackebrandtii TaxID=272161 RepID=A0ABS4Z1K5_9MICC|nr:cytochrome d ubiquinol oxidase subunit II [Arthrobacter stackebrandtii]MBP2414923.1 cytochrome d ubiquinol oxidase subunit II [Arthrobacter stackebrandtii]PYH00963.1 cytochrome d ubiquinol oxidase subunit II [Arthrobacter stackebrandtii]
MDFLPTLWFILIAVLWIGYLFLEGFDLGVGMLMKTFARGEKERRVLLNTVGPVWDGNEVWLLTAGGATFAAFPFWYASLFSALYIPLVFVLLGLIFRAVAFEYRGKVHNDTWRTVWDWAIALGSLVAAFGIGAMLALTTTGLPLNENGDRVGGAFAWFTWYAVIGGLAIVGFAVIHAAAFVALKTDGDIRHRARRLVGRWMPVGLAPMAVWAIAVALENGKWFSWLLIAVAVAAAVTSWAANRAGREGFSFLAMGGFLLAGAAAIFSAVYPVVLPSTLDPLWNLTVENASSSSYTLGLMSIVAAFGVPLVLAYQAWTYWIFRKRITAAHLPEPHDFAPAVALATAGAAPAGATGTTPTGSAS